MLPFGLIGLFTPHVSSGSLSFSVVTCFVTTQSLDCGSLWIVGECSKILPASFGVLEDNSLVSSMQRIA